MSKGKESRDVRVLIKKMIDVIDAASVDRKQNEEEMNVWVGRHRDLFRSSGVMQERGASSTENNATIYCLPEFMMGSVECKRWFVPAVTSIGPLQFRCSDGVGVVCMGAVARIKEEAISFIMEKYGDAERQKIMENLILDISGHEQKIKACYSDGTRIPEFLSGDRFAWMMVVDACYLLVALCVLSREASVESKRWPALAVLQGEGYRRQKVVHDLLKIENQIPLWVVRRVATYLPGWEPIANGELSQLVDMQKVLQRLSPFFISDLSDIVLTVFSDPAVSRWRRRYNDDGGTLLDIFLLFSLGENTAVLPRIARAKGGNWDDNKRSKRKVLAESVKVVERRSLEFLRFLRKILKKRCENAGDNKKSDWTVLAELVKAVMSPISDLLALLCRIWEKMELGSLTAQSVLPGQCWGPLNLVANLVTLPVQGSFVVLAMVVVAMGTVLLALVALPFIAVASMWQPRNSVQPSSVNLEAHAVLESGVKMNGSTTAVGILSAVYWREGGQLGLPHTRLDELAMVALWNMVAIEQLHPELASERTLSQYVCLMSDLLGSADDVVHLENEQIIEHVASSFRDDVVQMWQDLKLLATTSRANAHRDDLDQDILPYEDQSKSSSSDSCQSYGIQYAHHSLYQFVASRQHPLSWVRRLQYWINVLRSDYGSSPWLAISTVGAIALLLLSIVQVFCLFYKCPAQKENTHPASPHP